MTLTGAVVHTYIHTACGTASSWAELFMKHNFESRILLVLSIIGFCGIIWRHFRGDGTHILMYAMLIEGGYGLYCYFAAGGVLL